MRKKIGWCMLITFFLYITNLSAQNEKKVNPIVFLDLNVGSFASASSGFIAGAQINYQLDKHLLSLGYVSRMNIEISPVIVGFMAFPVFLNTGNTDEIAVLYGRRSIRNGHSFSFSAGPSYNIYHFRTEAENNPWERSGGFGLAVEGNVKLYKREKKRMRLYYVIPVGKPTSFGLNLGLRLSGNISQNSYAGISLVAGMGWHKKYD